MEARLVESVAQLSADYTPGAAVSAGEVVSWGNNTAIATRDIAADTPGSVALPSGTATYDVKKAAGGGVTFAVGALVFWDETNNTATATVTHKGLGICVKAAADGDATVRVQHTPIRVVDTT
jgi:predicted RecA/RadA family phage recombinase